MTLTIKSSSISFSANFTDGFETIHIVRHINIIGQTGIGTCGSIVHQCREPEHITTVCQFISATNRCLVCGIEEITIDTETMIEYMIRNYTFLSIGISKCTGERCAVAIQSSVSIYTFMVVPGKRYCIFTQCLIPHNLIFFLQAV